MIPVVRWVERFLGPPFVFWALLPWISWEVLRRRKDLRYFRELRHTLPRSFWKGQGSLRHFLRMIIRWQGVLSTCLLYDRLGSARWRKRIRFEGVPPDQLSEFQQRPAVLVFFHTGGFPIIRYWLRSRGIPAATFAGGQPSPLGRSRAHRVFEAGDRIYGLKGMAHVLTPASLRQTVQFLAPGRALVVALDGIATPGPLLPYSIDQQTIHVKDGAFRLAARSNAILMPVMVKHTGFLRYVIRFGEVVPDEFLQDPEPHRAHQALIEQLWKPIREDPCLLTWSTLESLAPEKRRYRTGWP